MKKTIAVMIALAMLLCACSGSKTSSTASTTVSQPSSEASSAPAEEIDPKALAEEFFSESAVVDTDLPYDALLQLDEDIPTGATIVTLTTTHGDIKLRMFPEIVPNAVENFVTHCENGYYDDVPFHRVMEDFMIQGGDPKGDGTGGESIWGGKFDDELSDNLHHFRGAISMANSGANSNGSQFFIVHSDDLVQEANLNSLMVTWYYNEISHQLNERASLGIYSQDELDALLDELNASLADAQKNGVPKEFEERYRPAAEKYMEVGGAYFLDYGYTVFGQVVEGMDVVDSIATVEVEASSTGELSKPVEEVYIISTSVTVTK